MCERGPDLDAQGSEGGCGRTSGRPQVVQVP